MTRSAWLKLSALLLFAAGTVVAVLVFGVDPHRFSIDRLRAFVLSYGWWAPVAYVVLYGQPIVPIPASLLTLAAGTAFGPIWGALAAMLGGMVRGVVQFGIARLLGREAVAQVLHGGAARLDRKLGDAGFRAVLLIRLVPSVPYDVQNYALGFSRVRFLPYVAGTLAGLIPGCFIYCYLGHSMTDMRAFWKLGVAMLAVAAFLGARSWWQHKRMALATPAGGAPPRGSSPV